MNKLSLYLLTVLLLTSCINVKINDSGTTQTFPSGLSNATQLSTLGASPSASLKVEDTVVGAGEEAQKGSLLTVNYTGTLEDGTVFDTTQGKQPFTFPLGQRSVIEGWEQGLVGMKVGGKRRLIIPAELGYGQQGSGKIPPNATLIFEIELVSLRNS